MHWINPVQVRFDIKFRNFMARDIEKHLPHLDVYDIPREEKVAIIEALYLIAETFADIAFGRHPAQMLSDNPQALWEALVASAGNDPVLAEYEDLLQSLGCAG